MRQFYKITETIKTQLLANSQCNVVTFGDIFDVDLNKQTIFPLGHIIVNQTSFEGQIVRVNLTVMAMDMLASEFWEHTLKEYFINLNSANAQGAALEVNSAALHCRR